MRIELSLLAALVGLFSLAACGGGGNLPSPPPDDWKPFVYVGPTVVTKTDLTVGSGAEAMPGKTVKMDVTMWAWSATPPGPNSATFPYTRTRLPHQAGDLCSARIG